MMPVVARRIATDFSPGLTGFCSLCGTTNDRQIVCRVSAAVNRREKWAMEVCLGLSVGGTALHPGYLLIGFAPYCLEVAYCLKVFGFKGRAPQNTYVLKSSGAWCCVINPIDPWQRTNVENASAFLTLWTFEQAPLLSHSDSTRARLYSSLAESGRSPGRPSRRLAHEGI